MKDFNEFLGNFLRVFRKFSRKPYARGQKRGKFPETLGPRLAYSPLSPLCPGPGAFYAFSFSFPVPYAAFRLPFWSLLDFVSRLFPGNSPARQSTFFRDAPSRKAPHAFPCPGLSAIPAAGFRCARALKAGENPRTSAVPHVVVFSGARLGRFLAVSSPKAACWPGG